MGEPLCRRCLLKDMTDSEYYESVYAYIESLTEDVKTPEDEYQRRIDLCSACAHLVNAMCDQCGCFVEVRAAKRNNSCAMSREIWAAV
jgi:hypothetical protein